MRLMTPYNLQVMSLPKTIVKSNYRIEIRMNTQQHHSIIVSCYCRNMRRIGGNTFRRRCDPDFRSLSSLSFAFPSVSYGRFWRKADAKISQIRLNRMSARTARRRGGIEPSRAGSWLGSLKFAEIEPSLGSAWCWKITE
jgi:hypothetical protein